MKIGQNDLKNLYFLLIIKTYHFFIQFSFKITFLCFVPSGNVQKKCTLHVPFSFMLNEKGGVDGMGSVDAHAPTDLLGIISYLRESTAKKR